MLTLFTKQQDIINSDLESGVIPIGQRDSEAYVHELTDAQWLRKNRREFGLSQSNIVSYLEITTWQNVNPGRVAEIETGQRCIPALWRGKLERLFSLLEQADPKTRNWRNFI